MSNPTRAGLNRRQLFQAAGATAALTAASGVAALSSTSVSEWEGETDVLVAGSGAAGISAALEARAAGADVLVVETLPRFGGASAMSGGVVYAGGGTALQRALKIDDTAEQMYEFIARAGTVHPPLDKVQLYCEESVAHFDWLVERGVPYTEKFTPAKGLPMGDESLYYSGTELAWPARDYATPAPRGHVPGVPGMNGGRRLMEALLASARSAGVRLLSEVKVERLIVESDGRVAGAQLIIDGEPRAVRARRGVVLACGGFIHNREMVKLYAPQLFNCSVPWGNAAEVGHGINMGIAAGAAALRMHEGFAIAPVYPPENVLSGILVNGAGQRFISEESYHGVLGDAIAYHQRGKAWLITDSRSSFNFVQDNFLEVASGDSIGALAAALPLPPGALQHTVEYYNRHAQSGRDPLFRKSTAYTRPLEGGPYKAWDLSVKNAFFPAHTFGGLHTDIDGRVFNSFGDIIPALYSVGRNSAGLPTAPYIASGLSVGDCTYFGRRAGRSVAAVRGSVA